MWNLQAWCRLSLFLFVSNSILWQSKIFLGGVWHWNTNLVFACDVICFYFIYFVVSELTCFVFDQFFSENHSGVGTVKLKAAFIISVSSYATEFKHCLIVTYMGKTMMHRLGWVWDVFIYIYEEDNWQICKNSDIRFLQRLYKVDLWFIQLCIMITSIKWSYQFLWPWFMFKVMHAGTQK